MKSIIETMKVNRPISVEISDLIYSRWSPRSMSGELLTEEEILALFESAKVAPSSYNNQPWRFVYVKRTDPEWNNFFSLLVEFNQGFCKDAALLIVVASKKNFDHNNKPCQTHSFDTGAAWMSLALEGNRRDLVVHAMQGFNYEKAAELCDFNEEFCVEAMIAVGKKAPKEHLSLELQEKETPSGRKSLKEIAFPIKYRK